MVIDGTYLQDLPVEETPGALDLLYALIDPGGSPHDAQIEVGTLPFSGFPLNEDDFASDSTTLPPSQRSVRVWSETHMVAQGAQVENVMDHGAVGDGATDDTAAIRAAIAALPASGGCVLYPQGRTFIISPDVANGRVFTLTNPNVTHLGYGATLKMADGVANYTNWFSGATTATDLSGTRFYGLTFDSNYENNVVADLTDITTPAIGGYTPRRNPIHIETGAGIRVEDCTFLNFCRQAIWLGRSTVPTACTGAVVRNCQFNITVTGSNPDDWDVTALFILGEDWKVIGNTIQGGNDNYYLSRTAMQLSGRGSVIGNNIDKFFRGIELGNSAYAAMPDGVVCQGNSITNANGGIELYVVVEDVPLFDTNPGCKNVAILGNTISLNPTGYLRDGGTGGYPVGIGVASPTDMPIENLEIAYNLVSVDDAWTGPDGDALITLLDSGTLNDSGTHKNFRVHHNTLVNATLMGIDVDLTRVQGLWVTDNVIVNPAQLDPAPGASNLCGVRIQGRVVMGEILDNDIIDDRGTHRIGTGVWVQPATSSPEFEAVRVRSGRLYIADGTVLPKVVLQNTTAAAAVVLDPVTSVQLADQDHPLNDTTLADATNLGLPLLRGQWYEIEGVVKCEGSLAAEIKIGFTIPTGATGYWAPGAAATGATSSTSASGYFAARDWGDAASFGTIAASGFPTWVKIQGLIRCTTSDNGVLQLQFAQASGDAVNATSILANSYLKARPIDRIEELVA